MDRFRKHPCHSVTLIAQTVSSLSRSSSKLMAWTIMYQPAGKSNRCKFFPLQLVMLILLLATIITVLSAPTICYQNILFHTFSKWLWGGPDPRYTSDLDINWKEILIALEQLPEHNKIKGIGLLNFNKSEIHQWKQFIPTANHTVLHLEPAEKTLTWESLYPEWIDEEQEFEVPKCPSLPKIMIPRQQLELIAVKLPCTNKLKCSRDIARLHIQIAAAGLAASSKRNDPMHLLFFSTCFPVPNLFTYKDLVAPDTKAHELPQTFLDS